MIITGYFLKKFTKLLWLGSYLELEMRLQEQIAKVAARNLTVYRLDFTATIKNAAGEYRKILIEIQKAKFDTDIMRFRRYLGNQYSDPMNVQFIDGYKIALPLVTIYFLGHSLKYINTPVIHVTREFYDLTTREKLTGENEEFIESLTHDSYIIQIARLRHERQSEIEKLLQIFDQGKIPGTDKHILEINEHDVPEKYRPIIRKLHRAIAEQKLVAAMDIEDDILESLQNLERKVESERIEKAQALIEKDRAVVEKDQALREKIALQEKNERLRKILKDAGIDSE